jgi:putative endopeptidase
MTTPNSHSNIGQFRTLLLITTILWPAAVTHAQAVPDSRAAPLEQGVNPSIRPGDDFFAYANGAWLKVTAIPAGKERWGERDEIVENTRQQLEQLLAEAAEAPPRSPARMVADFRAALLDRGAIDAKGFAPLRPAFDSIARVKDKTTLAQLLGRGMRADVDPLNWGVYQSSHLFGLSVEPSIHGEKRYVAFLLQGGLGLPDREQYLSVEPHAQALRLAYQAYVARTLALAGFDHGAERAAGVMGLETALARSEATRAATANDHNADHVWSRADFAARAPGMDWQGFFAAAGLANVDTVVAWQPAAVQGIAALVASQPLAAWQDYLRFHAIADNVDALPRPFAEAALAFRGAITATADSTAPAQRALAATELAMSDLIGQMYAERYFPADQKRRVQGIVNNVAAAFAKRVQTATWMSPATKAMALAKLKMLYVGIGYPERWQDYADLQINRHDAFGNAQRLTRRNYRHAAARIGQPIDVTDWWIAPQTVGGILIFQQNAYEFPAALLQAPKYDRRASDAASYGAIGAIIGHDISHYVDMLGAEYDTTGAMRHWWPVADSTRFVALATPLARQFSGYHPFPNASVDGELTRSENIADLAGLSAAFDAYRATLGNHTSDTAYVRQQDREFFLGFAQSWRARMSENALRLQLANDHAPEMYRVATVRNLDAWYDAFDVRPGDQLYLAPSARVRIW